MNAPTLQLEILRSRVDVTKAIPTYAKGVNQRGLLRQPPLNHVYIDILARELESRKGRDINLDTGGRNVISSIS